MRPVYYSTYSSIRFAIDTDSNKLDKNAESKPVDRALARALTIFSEMFGDSNVLVMYDNFNPETEELEFMRNTILSNYEEESFELDEDLYNSIDSTRYLFKMKASDINQELMLRQIMSGEEIEGYVRNFTSCVYVFNLDTKMMYYLYDERGLDIASVELESLKPLYNKYNDWLLTSVKEDMGEDLKE